ncbi:hypothetical protein KZC52_14115 [Microbacterium sp. kSW2-24]|uniref:hypothetical protein n=1 Tax=Microbacterium galbinum TaxID=2851646 RepID=UPI001FFCA8DB|nr:hypothetical protein [Microbacterium galbinum]MCK2024070.1 hypothetical protein [Microbacterium galbinum]
MGGALMIVDLGHGRGWLEVEAAKSQARIDRALGHPQQITEAGRSWEQQNAHWLTFQKYGKPIALHPDTPSVHQKGRAKDTDERPVALLNDHGWFQTVFRWINGVWTLVEPWHFEYFPERDNHRHEVVELVNDNGTWRIAPEKEWDEMATEAQIRAVVADEVQKALVTSKAITEKAVKQYSRAGAYKIVGVQGTKNAPGPHMYLTGPGGSVHLPTQPDVDLMRRYIQATAHVLDAPYNPKSASVNGEELLTPAQFKTAMLWIARMKPEPEPVKSAAASS